MKNVFLCAAVILTLMLSACGGGGSSSAASDSTSTSRDLVETKITSTAEGLWIGLTNSGRKFSGIVLDDGTYWFLYSNATTNILEGVVQGTGNSNNGNFTSSNTKDFNFVGLGILSASVSASYTAKQTFNGLINYSGSPISFSGTYNTGYDQTPTLAKIAGSYSGVSGSTGETASVVISSTGVLSGTSETGCSYFGSVSPHASGNVYDLSVQFNGGVCSNGTSKTSGIAYLDASTNILYALGLNSNRTNGFLFYGAKR